MVDQSLTTARIAVMPRGAALATLLAIAVFALGCASGPGPGASSGQGSYRDHYEAGRYQLALASARATAGQPGGTSEAALVAGLSAEAMRDDATARLWLQPIARGNGDLSPRARAGLALIELRTGDPATAARELESVSLLLGGHDGREAARVAAEAYERAGRTSDADRLRRRSAGMLEPGRVGEPGYASGSFTLQVGAYSTRSRANQRSTEVASASRSAGLGEPRVEFASRGGQALYLVQIGRFMSEADAQRAQRSLGISTIVARAE